MGLGHGVSLLIDGPSSGIFFSFFFFALTGWVPESTPSLNVNIQIYVYTRIRRHTNAFKYIYIYIYIYIFLRDGGSSNAEA